MAVIECGPWRPDQPELGSPGVTEAINCYPASRGFRPMLGKAEMSNALTARPLGAYAATSLAGVVHNYAGDATKLYDLNAATWTDISKVGGYTNTATYWDFAEYAGISIATNFADNPQFVDMDAGSPVFADLTTAFKARYCAVVREFVVFGNTNDATDGNVPGRVRWSAAGDYTDYTVSATTQSDFRDIPFGGAIQRVFGGEYGIIFLRRSIVRMTYAGPPVIFQLDEIAPDTGLYAPGAAAQDGEVIFFLDNSGFYALSAGQNVSPIGNEKVDNWFWQELDGTQKDRISCAIDHKNKIVSWAFPASGNINGKPNRVLQFDYEIGEWTYSDIDSDLIYSALTVGFTIDTLDTLAANADAQTISADSPVLFSGNKYMGVFDDFKLNYLAGSQLTATIETKEIQPAQGKRSVITEGWPMVDGGETTITIGTRNRQQDDVVWGAASAVNTVGFAPLRSEGRYIRARMEVTGFWDEIQGIELTGAGQGRR